MGDRDPKRHDPAGSGWKPRGGEPNPNNTKVASFVCGWGWGWVGRGEQAAESGAEMSSLKLRRRADQSHPRAKPGTQPCCGSPAASSLKSNPRNVIASAAFSWLGISSPLPAATPAVGGSTCCRRRCSSRRCPNPRQILLVQQIQEEEQAWQQAQWAQQAMAQQPPEAAA